MQTLLKKLWKRKKTKKEGDEKDEDDSDRNAMRGIAMYASNKDDPYFTEHVDSDAEDEKDEFEIRPDDNLVAVAKINKDEYTLEVHVYNEADDDWYCHHDYILDAPPLCLEPIQHDPGNDESGKGNLLAIGTMNSTINIWDLDIVNAAEPVVTLGNSQKPGKTKKKRDGSAQGHSDAVLSLAWNKLTDHVVASGGADKQVVLWDLDEAKAAQVIPNRGGEVQCLKWHPVESTFIILGTMAGGVQVLDCRDTSGQASAEWKFEGQVERIQWNHFNPFTSFVATDDGTLRYIDMRKAGETVWKVKAHEDSIGGLSLSAVTRGLLTTVGHDQILNVWKVQDDGVVNRIHSEKLALGPLHSLQFNPDVATIICVGGSSNDLIRVMDLAKIDAVVQAFS